ncbi:hypothetical protein VTJ83DRAFT_3597 [Remersonia thermophila]|uniref:t-SNARE coiled-coil homology domain-containing protein n=1 Tax=Remersonia thermophila TaxID=72144 RepID=A0ABR4DEK5_9PEZI
MSYNPYAGGPSSEAGYGYGYDGHGQHEQHELQSYGQQPSSSLPPQYGQQYGQTSAAYGSVAPPEQSPYGMTPQQQPQQQQQQQGGRSVRSQIEFLARVKSIREEIQSLTVDISNIATLHQQALASGDDRARSQLDDLVAATQVKNTSIRTQIQNLKADTERTTDGSFAVKKRQWDSLNTDFKETIRRFLQEEQQYKQRYREQIARQYRIVNPDATEEQVQQAADANWGDEGIFQAALRTNRTGHATAVLGNVRARHNDMVKIERSIVELLDLLEILNQEIVQQGNVIDHVGNKVEETTGHLDAANTQIEKGVKLALATRRKKWICLFICVLIIIAIALGVGLGVALTNRSSGN